MEKSTKKEQEKHGAETKKTGTHGTSGTHGSNAPETRTSTQHHHPTRENVPQKDTASRPGMERREESEKCGCPSERREKEYERKAENRSECEEKK